MRRCKRALAGALVPVLLAASAAGLLAGCESTQSKSARLEKQGGGNVAEHGLVVRKENPAVKVLWTQAIKDRNGAAIVVAMKNTSTRSMARVPVAFEVQGAGGKTLFKNDTPGLQASLTEAPLLRPRESFFWVNDQVNTAGQPRKARAKVGISKARPDSSPPRIAVSEVQLRNDPVDGPQAVGKVLNRSAVEQRKLILYGTVRRGSEVVAAGRALITRLKPKKSARFQLFFIGNPRRGRLTLAAPPTVLR